MVTAAQLQAPQRGRPGLPGSQGEETGSPGRSFAHSQLRTHHSPQAHVRAYTRMPEDAHSLTPTCTHSYMPCPRMPSSAHRLAQLLTLTQAHAHPHVCMLTFILTCVPPHTPVSLKHTDTHRLPTMVCSHTQPPGAERTPSVGDPCALGKAAWVQMRATSTSPQPLHPVHSAGPDRSLNRTQCCSTPRSRARTGTPGAHCVPGSCSSGSPTSPPHPSPPTCEPASCPLVKTARVRDAE